MSKADCDWRVIEKGRTYSILQCEVCKRETAIGPGERIRVEQFNCPFDVEESSERKSRGFVGDRLAREDFGYLRQKAVALR